MAATAGAVENDCINDPFLTHTLPALRPEDAPESYQASVAQAAPGPVPLSRNPLLSTDREPYRSQAMAREIDIVDDPFMRSRADPEALVDRRMSTRLDPWSSQGSVAREPLDVQKDPFLSGVAFEDAGPADLMSDPFLTHPHYDAAARGQGKTDRSLRNKVEHALGKGDPNREAKVGRVLVLLPWGIFLWVLLLRDVMWHYTVSVSIAVISFLVVTPMVLVAAWGMGKRATRIPLITLSILWLVAACLGIHFGQIGWDHFWRQHWWMRTGFTSADTAAETPAGSRLDSAVIDFWDDKTQRSVNGTAVDSSKSAGFKNGRIFCVAPILSPVVASATGITRVNYWAIGIDCCQPLGHFTCDESRHHSGAYGVVSLDGGFPCPSCNVEDFRTAVAKAESAHDLASGTDAIFVRWVKNPGNISWWAGWHAVWFLITMAIVSFPLLGGAGFAAWYYGWGSRLGESSFSGLGFDPSALKLSSAFVP